MTTSGYPRIAKDLEARHAARRGHDRLRGEGDGYGRRAYHDATPGFARDFLFRRPSFFTGETFLLGKDGAKQKIDVPDDAETSVHREWLFVRPRSAVDRRRKIYPGGLAARRALRRLHGREARSLGAVRAHRDDVAQTRPDASPRDPQRARRREEPPVRPDAREGRVEAGAASRAAPALGPVSAGASTRTRTTAYFMTVTDFLTPTTLQLGRSARPPEKLKETPAFFDATGLEISQHFAASKDGTRIPYFQVSRKGLMLDGTHPTLLSGYGGFEVSKVPYYSGGAGRAWLSQGGVSSSPTSAAAVSTGPQWHQAALKQNRPRAYEDLSPPSPGSRRAQGDLRRAPRHRGRKQRRASSSATCSPSTRSSSARWCARCRCWT